MKKMFVMAFVALVLSSCGASKNNQTASNSVPKNPFGEVYDIPIAVNTDEENFGATGISTTGVIANAGELQFQAVENAKKIIRAQLAHSFKSVTDSYFNNMGNNLGTDSQNKLEGAGSEVIKRLLNDVKYSIGPKFTTPDNKGLVQAFYGIKIPKATVAQEFTDAVADVVSEDEELKIRFKESQFRKRFDEEFGK